MTRRVIPSKAYDPVKRKLRLTRSFGLRPQNDGGACYNLIINNLFIKL
jgi:hypothetical protein